MSDLADYARKIHEECVKKYERELCPVEYESKYEKIGNVKAVIFDIYGTIINYWRPGFDDKQTRQKILYDVFKEVCEFFEMEYFLKEINPKDPPEKTLGDFYHGLIALSHEEASKKGKAFPEVKIEEVWNVILSILMKHGYDRYKLYECTPEELARRIAFRYNFLSLGRELYPGVVSALEKLKEQNIVLGILSNAQFYTPIDLTLMIRDQSNGKYDDLFELFDVDLTFFSYEYGIAKPDQALYRRLYDALYEYHILPSQTVMVGNDLILDIKPSQDNGMKTAFFCGDSCSAFTHDLGGKVIPDISFSSWEEFSSRVSFHSQENGTE